MSLDSNAVIQDDIAAILRALGLGDHGRPCSPHQVVQDEILPAIDAWVSEALALRGKIARLQQQHYEVWVALDTANAELDRLAPLTATPGGAE